MLRRGLASSAQHHQEDGPASSPENLSMGTEQCAVVFSSVVVVVVVVVARSTQHHQGDGRASSLGHVSHGQRAESSVQW